jgi:hypothetical protein
VIGLLAGALNHRIHIPQLPVGSFLIGMAQSENIADQWIDRFKSIFRMFVMRSIGIHTRARTGKDKAFI